MNINKNDSLIEIALQVMKKKTTEQPLDKISKEVFEIKGLDINKEKELLAQFEMDFMLSGLFICCGDKNSKDKKSKVKVWDLKNRKKSEFLDKESEFDADEDEDVKENLLTEIDDDTYGDDINKDEDEDEDEDDEIEKDDIEEELNNGDDLEEEESTYEINEDDDEEDSYDDEDK